MEKTASPNKEMLPGLFTGRIPEKQLPCAWYIDEAGSDPLR
jgi:hypothetical protein